MLSRWGGWAFLAAIASCNADDAGTGPAAGGGTGGSSGDQGTTGGSADDGTDVGDGTTQGATTTGDDDEGPQDDASFVFPHDGGPSCAQLPPGFLGHCFPCTPWLQDCARGDKCLPWSADGSGVWTDTRCAPVARNPAALGETCQVEGNAASGLDDCDLGLACMFVDPETNMGTCVAQCSGKPAEPECPESTSCFVGGSGVLTLCLPACDPFGRECSSGGACVPGDEGFVCVPNVAEPAGYGETCVSSEECGAGLTCAEGQPADCEGIRCCAALCNLADVDADLTCPDVDAGQVCSAVYDDPAPAGYESAGVCTTP